MDFPDPEEEYELMHAEEMEMMNDLDQEYDDFPIPEKENSAPKSKRCLDFTSPRVEASSSKTSQRSFNSNQKLVDLTQKESEINYGASTSNSSFIATTKLSQVQPETIGHSLQKFVETANDSKRKADDLFGDIDDIDFDEDHLLKKSKLEEQYTDEERQLMTIEKIVAERQKLQNFKILPRSLGQNLSNERKAAVKLTYSVPKWPFFPITDGKGERIYARFMSEEFAEKEIAQIGSHNNTGSLLHIPFEKLEEMAHAELQKKWNRIEANNTNPPQIEMVEANGGNSELWVEKYRPRNYLELLSDEGTNRALLKWLKMWDKVVFNRESRVKKKPKEEKKGRFGRFQKKTGPIVNEEYDEHGRPFHKVALLCGPPGLGKTTLAHMIATQAGYNIVEVNASDDRTPDIFRTQLEAATQMRAVMGEERRPNCLVLDEIDGTPQASIDVVIKFIEGRGLAKGRGKTKKAVGTSGTAGILKRPIICICNDVYVPALRPLRQIAFVVHFPPIASARLAQRLCEIAHLQALKTDLGAMMALSEKTNNDIRACLSLLHCLKSQSGNVIRLSQIHSAALGNKDMQKGLFTVWQEIFQIQRAKPKRFVEKTPNKLEPMPDLTSPELKCGSTSLTSRMMSVLRTVQGAGDYDRLAQGVYENFLNMKIKESSMKSVADGLSWFCHHDLLSTTILSTQNYVLYPYIPYSFVMWHFLFANLSWPKLTYPSTGYEMSVRSQRYTQLLDEVMRNMQPYVRAYTHKDQLLLDVGPLLLEIIIPNLRPVSLQLYSQKEKDELHHVISVMIDYNLTYTQERTQDASYVFNLDPNIEEVCRFNSGKGARMLSYAGRQLMSREIELEKLRRAEANLYRNVSTQPTQTKTKEIIVQELAASKYPTTPKGPAKKSLPNHLQKLTPKAVKNPTDLQTRDFFGRVVENSLVEDHQKAKTDEIVKSDIWFHFKEGFNNAVRRSVDMKDLY